MTSPIGKGTPFCVDLGIRIRDRRKFLRMTATEFANNVGVSPQTVCDWEAGRNQMPLFRIGYICRALEVTVAQLLGDDLINAGIPKSGFNEGVRRCMAETDYLFRMTGSPHYEALTKRFCSFLEEEGEG